MNFELLPASRTLVVGWALSTMVFPALFIPDCDHWKLVLLFAILVNNTRLFGHESLPLYLGLFYHKRKRPFI
jgi:hypothetical protein